MKISVVIPTTGNVKNLQRLLKSLADQDFQDEWEILLVFNPPNKKAEVVFSESPRVRAFHSEKRGANIARNIGVNNAKGEIIVFLDDDCETAGKDFLQKHWIFHSENKSCAGMGSGYLTGPSVGYWEKAYHHLQEDWLVRGAHPGFFSDLVFGGNLSVKKSAFSDISFTEELVYGGTETDFVFKSAAVNRRVVFRNEPSVRHLPGMGPLRFLRKAYFQGMGARFLQAKKYYGVRTTIPYYPVNAFKENNHFQFPAELYGIAFQLGYGMNCGTSFSRAAFGVSFIRLLQNGLWGFIKRGFFSIWNFLELVMFLNREKEICGRRTGLQNK